MTYPIPAEAFDDRLAIFGTAGAGKTYLTIGAMARLLARKSRIIGVDPLGVMYGLRLNADGKTPSDYNVVIFGGPHGDLPLNEHAGALIGETAATMRESCILDLSELGTKAAERRFMLAFLTALYRHANKEPVHLIVDEADMFAPQKLLDKDGDAAKLLGMMETVVRRGRVKGFVPWLISQRPAVLSKDVLSQADGVIALKLTAKQDKDAFEGWIEGAADKATGRSILASLPNMERGQGVIWVPGRRVLKTSTFPANKTFDSSRTPARGEKRASVTMPALDLTKLQERLAKITEETKANDPRALKMALAATLAELAKLRRLSASSNETAKNNVPDQKSQDRATAAGYAQGWDDGWRTGWSAGHTVGAQKQIKEFERTAIVFTPPASDTPKPPKAPSKGLSSPSPPPIAQFTPRAAVSPAPSVRPLPRTNGATVHLPPGERAVLIAAAQFNPVEREQLTILTGYKRSSRDAYIQRLREKGYVEAAGSIISITDAGMDVLPADYEPLPTGVELQDYWLVRLPEGERKILQALINHYPEAVERTKLDDITGYKRSSRDAYLQRMKAKRLWIGSGSSVTAAEMLFS